MFDKTGFIQLTDLAALQEISQKQEDSSLPNHVDASTPEGVVSFYAELPVALQVAMAGFIERYPNWDQYRLIQAAMAGFLVQNGVESRQITRLYVGNMFGGNSMLNGI